MSGYIKLYRGWRDTNGLLSSGRFSDHEAWLWLLENCAWKELSRWNSKGEEIKLQPGQIHVSIRSLAAAWGWSNKAVRTFLTRLERVQKVAQLKAQSGTVLTICNWGKYQTDDSGGGHGLDNGRGTAGAQSGHTQEEGKEGKEGKNYAFAGKIVRLNFEDLQRWKQAFPDLDLMPLLTARDDWLIGQPEADQKRWFPSTSSWLANKQQQAFERRPPNEPVIGI